MYSFLFHQTLIQLESLGQNRCHIPHRCIDENFSSVCLPFSVYSSTWGDQEATWCWGRIRYNWQRCSEESGWNLGWQCTDLFPPLPSSLVHQHTWLWVPFISSHNCSNEDVNVCFSQRTAFYNNRPCVLSDDTDLFLNACDMVMMIPTKVKRRFQTFWSSC